MFVHRHAARGVHFAHTRPTAGRCDVHTSARRRGFFDAAPWRFTDTFDIGLPRVRCGQNSLRTARCRSLRGARIVDEVYFRWEDGRRQSFYVERANLPMFRLTWTIAGALALQ